MGYFEPTFVNLCKTTLHDSWECVIGLDRKWLSTYVNTMIPMKVGMWISGFVLFAFEFLCICIGQEVRVMTASVFWPRNSSASSCVQLVACELPCRICR
jgi:hypothetical protein